MNCDNNAGKFDISTCTFTSCEASSKHGHNIFISGKNFKRLITKQKFENIDYSIQANLYGIDLDVTDDSSLLPLSSYLSNDRTIYLNELTGSEDVNNCGTSTNPCKLSTHYFFFY
jgi:hypothetical protein